MGHPLPLYKPCSTSRSIRATLACLLCLPSSMESFVSSSYVSCSCIQCDHKQAETEGVTCTCALICCLYHECCFSFVPRLSHSYFSSCLYFLDFFLSLSLYLSSCSFLSLCIALSFSLSMPLQIPFPRSQDVYVHSHFLKRLNMAQTPQCFTSSVNRSKLQRYILFHSMTTGICVKAHDSCD